MRKGKLLRIVFLTIVMIVIFSIGKKVSANSIEKISMDISLDYAGDATITEVWECYTNQGTEVYHPYYNLGESTIRNLTVIDNGRQYTTLSSWDTEGSISEKAYKCGLNYVTNGVEICWGMNSYTNHTYTVTYTITNFVAQLTDEQMIYWTLIPQSFSNRIGHVYIKIHAPFEIKDSIDVWGYGNYGGTAYVYDGYIEMQSNGSLSTDEYMTILVKFPNGTFETVNILDKNFNYYYNMAEEGSIAYQEEGTNLIDKLMGMIVGIFTTIFFIGSLMIGNREYQKTQLDFGPGGKKIPKDVMYYRDIPCNKDLFRAYYIANVYGLLKNKTDILGAIILKWLKDGQIRIEQKEVGNLFKKEDTVIILNETTEDVFADEKERELFRMLKIASKDGILENKEFEQWCKKSYEKVLGWFDKIISREENECINEGLIIKEDRGSVFKYKKKVATSKLREQAIQIAGLKRYLKEYTLIKDRQAIEVKLFEEYLVFAQMLGIAKEVAKEFKDLYPEIIEQSAYGSYDYIIFVHTYSSHGMQTASNARAQAYSGGGGGFSSGGGGMGSFGGGGGGGGFR